MSSLPSNTPTRKSSAFMHRGRPIASRPWSRARTGSTPLRQPRLRRQHPGAWPPSGTPSRRSCRCTRACTAAPARSRSISTDGLRATRATSSPASSARRTARVVFVRNTTEAINVLATALPPRHAGALHARSSTTRTCSPGAGTTCGCCPSPTSADAAARGHARTRCATRRIDLLAVTGASNVTGEVWPLARARRARARARRAAVRRRRAARAAPRDRHGRDAGIDHLALSGHKLYAPFGAGALVSRAPLDGRPADHGGGAIKLVTLDDVDLGRRARPLRGRLAQRHRRRRARRGLRRARRSAWTRRRGARVGARRPPARRPGRRSTA